jgi:hypothetical protein
METIEQQAFAPTAFALTLDEGNRFCRRLDMVAQWVQDWDAVQAPMALFSDATETHSYVAKIEITGRSVRFQDATGTPYVRVRVTFADPEVGTCGADLIMVGGKFFTMEDAKAVAK